LRLVYGKRTARTSTTRLDAEGLDELVARTAEVAKLAPEDKDLLPVLGDGTEDACTLVTVSGATANSTPEERAQAVKRVLDAVGVARCGAAANPGDVEPGAYEVILEPAAVKDLVDFLYWGGFTGRSYEDGDTWSAGLRGKKIFDEKITIRDDFEDERNPGA